MKKLFNKFKKWLNSIYLCIRFPFLFCSTPDTLNYFLYKHIRNAQNKLDIHTKVDICNKSYINYIKNNNIIQDNYITNSELYITKHINDYYGSDITVIKENNNIHFTISNKHGINKQTFKLSDILTTVYKKLDVIKDITENDISDIYFLKKIKNIKTYYTEVDKQELSLLVVSDKLTYNDKSVYLNFITILLDPIQKYIIKIYNCLNKIINIVTISNIYCLYYDIPSGWRNAFGMQLCKDMKHSLLYTYIREENISYKNIFKYIIAYCKGIKLLYGLQITQIKEKFGTLRIYVSHGTNDLHKVIDRYEHLSYNTCINCGKPAEYISNGWISPYCETCITDKNNAIKLKNGQTDTKYIDT